MKEKLINILEIQDSFKSPFQFLFNGKRNIHVPFGMILSLFINFANICLTITLILQLINHSQPNINYAKFTSSMTVNMSLNTCLYFGYTKDEIIGKTLQTCCFPNR